MKVKITRNAAKQLKTIIDQEEDKDLKLRVYITHAHSDHVHYGLALDKPTEEDEVIETDKEIDVIVKKDEPLLDGIILDYLYLPQEGFVITNPSKGNTGDH